MPKLAKNFLFVAFLMLTAFSAEAAELWRLRYFVPTSSESEITFGSSKAAEKLNTSGHSGNWYLQMESESVTARYVQT